jgi:hypothetical protein
MAPATVLQRFHHIGTPIPMRVLRCVGNETGIVEKCQVSECERPAHAEWPWNWIHRRSFIDGSNILLQIRKEILEVLIGKLGKGGVRHCRITATTIGPYPEAHDTSKILETVAADAGFAISVMLVE